MINPEKIGEVVGPRGKTINKIIEETGVKIDIEDDGTVFIATNDAAAAARARSMVEGITKELQVGDVFTGKVVRVMSFGAFVEYAPGKEGLVHISKLQQQRTEKVEDVVAVGDRVRVKFLGIDEKGRSNLSMKDAAPVEE
jgi:polyribonucleotide nucleotidyltransferase